MLVVLLFLFSVDIIVLYFQVHHGGAGTTAAGLKAAVTRYVNFSEHLFFVHILHRIYEIHCFSI